MFLSVYLMHSFISTGGHVTERAELALGDRLCSRDPFRGAVVLEDV